MDVTNLLSRSISSTEQEKDIGDVEVRVVGLMVHIIQKQNYYICRSGLPCDVRAMLYSFLHRVKHVLVHSTVQRSRQLALLQSDTRPPERDD